MQGNFLASPTPTPITAFSAPYCAPACPPNPYGCTGYTLLVSSTLGNAITSVPANLGLSAAMPVSLGSAGGVEYLESNWTNLFVNTPAFAPPLAAGLYMTGSNEAGGSSGEACAGYSTNSSGSSLTFGNASLDGHSISYASTMTCASYLPLYCVSAMVP